MAGLLSVATLVHSAHGGAAVPATPTSRVRVVGAPVMTIAIGYVVAGCPHQTPDGRPDPCTAARWTTGAGRVRIAGQPAVLDTSQAVCTPTATGLVVATPGSPRVRTS